MSPVSPIEKRIRRKKHVRKKVYGSTIRPRLAIFKSNKYLFAQLADDDKGTCVCGLTEKVLAEKKGEKPMDRAVRFGVEFAKVLKKKKIETIVFDRGGYLYHGRIKAFADSLRKEGINF